jgi:hypothetical protein
MKETATRPRRNLTAPRDDDLLPLGRWGAAHQLWNRMLTSQCAGEWISCIPLRNWHRRRPLCIMVPLPDVTAARRRSLTLGCAGIGANAGLTFFSRDLGAILALTEVAAPAASALILLIAVLCGSYDTCERAFRLLRWLVNRPEPPSTCHRSK